MEDGNEAHLRSQMPAIFCQLLEGLRYRPEKDGVDHLLVSQCQGPYVFRKSEGQVKIDNREQVLFPGLKPTLFLQTLAFGAMAIPAGVMRYPQGATMVAFIYMASELSTAADLDSPHSPVNASPASHGLAGGVAHKPERYRPPQWGIP